MEVIVDTEKRIPWNMVIKPSLLKRLKHLAADREIKIMSDLIEEALVAFLEKETVLD